MEKTEKKITIKDVHYVRVPLDKEGEIMLNVIYDDNKNFKIFLDNGVEVSC